MLHRWSSTLAESLVHSVTHLTQGSADLLRCQAEFDKPSELLKKESSLLHKLVEESGDKEKLYAMANGTQHVA